MRFINMVKKIGVILVLVVLITPIGNIAINHFDTANSYSGVNTVRPSISFSQNRPYVKWSEWSFEQQFGFFIRTIFNDIEKNSPVLEAMVSGIDIDNNPSTGDNGKDLKVTVIVLPLIQETDIGWVLSVHVALKIIRLGDEIKTGELEVCLGGHVDINGEQQFRIGYYSPANQEIPREIREVVTIVPYFNYEHDPEFYFNIEPVFEDGTQDLSVILEYGNDIVGRHNVMLDYFPAVTTLVKLSPHLERQQIEVNLERTTDVEQTLRLQYDGSVSVNVTLEDIPNAMEFTMGFSEAYFEYTANDEFDITMIVEMEEVAYLLSVEYLPRNFKIQFGFEGYLDVTSDSGISRFIFANDLEQPSSYLLLTNLTGRAIVQWSIAANGSIIIDGFAGLHAEFYINSGSVYFRSYAELQSEHFEMIWNIAIPGFVSIDTNWQWVSEYSFNMSLGNIFGVLIESSFLRANNYEVSWQTEIPFFSKTGTLELSNVNTFNIMINGIWYSVL